MFHVIIFMRNRPTRIFLNKQLATSNSADSASMSTTNEMNQFSITAYWHLSNLQHY